jgi:hypothetical protein
MVRSRWPEEQFSVSLRCGACRRPLVDGAVSAAGHFHALYPRAHGAAAVEQDPRFSGRGTFVCRCGARWTYRESTLRAAFASAITRASGASVEIVTGVDL